MRHSRAQASSPRRAISKPTPAEASLGHYLKLMQSPSTTTRIRLANDPERLRAPCTALRSSTTAANRLDQRYALDGEIALSSSDPQKLTGRPQLAPRSYLPPVPH